MPTHQHTTYSSLHGLAIVTCPFPSSSFSPTLRVSAQQASDIGRMNLEAPSKHANHQHFPPDSVRKNPSCLGPASHTGVHANLWTPRFTEGGGDKYGTHLRLEGLRLRRQEIYIEADIKKTTFAERTHNTAEKSYTPSGRHCKCGLLARTLPDPLVDSFALPTFIAGTVLTAQGTGN